MKAATTYPRYLFCDHEEYNCYNVGCNLLGGDIETFPDAIEAARDGIDYCGDDAECYKGGNNWSKIFLANGILLILVVVNMLVIIKGTMTPIFRLVGAWLAAALCLAHFGIVIYTAVYRFYPGGRICALDNTPTGASGDEVEDTWTYKKDASLMLALWILQLLSMVICCAVGLMPLKPTV